MKTKIMVALFFFTLPLWAQAQGGAKARVYDDSTRLASLLQDLQSKAAVSPARGR